MIETDLAESAGLGDLEGACDEVADDIAVGETFGCTGTTPDGDEVQFIATIKSDDEVAVDSTNLISADGMTALETTAASLLAEQVGQPLEGEAIDCGTGPRVFDVDSEVLTCDLTDPISGAVYETTIELTGLGAEDQMSIVVAETPKG